MMYRVDVSLGRYSKDKGEINEFDLNNGIVYMDMTNNKSEFYFLSDVS